MKLKRGKKKEFFVSVNSTSDIAFLLLIFIMLVSLINYRETVDIDFALARAALVTDAARNLEVWVDSGGALYLDAYPATLAELEERVIDLVIEAPDTRVHILADRHTPYMYVSAVLEILQLLQYRVVSLVVQNVE